MDNCSDCKNCVHLVSDSHLLKKEKLFSQLVCAFCWVPLINSTQSTLENSSVVTECGHVFHQLCLEHRTQLLRDTPLRCPMDGHIIQIVKALHFNDYVEETMNNVGNKHKELQALLTRVNKLVNEMSDE